MNSPIPAPSPSLILTIIQPNMVDKTIVGVMTLTELRTVFQRALNTWASAPQHLVQISDGLDTMADLHEIMVKRQMQAFMRAQQESGAPNPPVTQSDQPAN